VIPEKRKKREGGELGIMSAHNRKKKWPSKGKEEKRDQRAGLRICATR